MEDDIWPQTSVELYSGRQVRKSKIISWLNLGKLLKMYREIHFRSFLCIGWYWQPRCNYRTITLNKTALNHDSDGLDNKKHTAANSGELHSKHGENKHEKADCCCSACCILFSSLCSWKRHHNRRRRGRSGCRWYRRRIRRSRTGR